MGPVSRVAEFKAIETTPPFVGLQQVRWAPSRLADTPEQALQRLFWVYDGGDHFAAELTGDEEVPAVATNARAAVEIELKDGKLAYRLWATGPITDATMAHIHLGGYQQNGAVVAILFHFHSPRSFVAGELVASGELGEADVLARPGFTPTVANLVERIRQGRAYVNLHTTAHPPGEIRGQLLVIDRDPVSHYSDPAFSWRYEVAPAGLGFIRGRQLGPQYEGDLVVGAARPLLADGHLFRLQLTGNRRKVAVDDPRLEDRVADNHEKYDITESESLLFGTGFGIGTDIRTGPGGQLYVVSLTHGAVYEIARRSKGKR
jgi:hypothetical protein